MRWVPVEHLRAEATSQAHSAPYQATKVQPLLRLLRDLELPRDCRFLDIGSGKGRVLLIAAQYGFSKVIGIEFSQELCETARKNVAIFAARKPLASPIEVLHVDATSYQFDPADQVLFMYNPFDGEIMREVLRNVEISIKAFPRTLWMIYNTPKQLDTVLASGLFETCRQVEIGGNRFAILVHQVRPQA
jgi:SAM-dependent methyltransferase